MPAPPSEDQRTGEPDATARAGLSAGLLSAVLFG